MLQSDKEALHYIVIANAAHKIEKCAKELEALYKASIFNKTRVELRKYHLKKYTEELEESLNRVLIKHPIL